MSVIQNVLVLQSPTEVSKEVLDEYGSKVFLAGGISNCPNWQQDAIDTIIDSYDWQPGQLVLMNPRLENFDPTAGPEVINRQVKWEFKCLNEIADVHLFWFPMETMCPITLYELGRSVSDDETQVIVGMHPQYQRLTTMKQQLKLLDWPIEVANSIEDLSKQLLSKVVFPYKPID